MATKTIDGIVLSDLIEGWLGATASCATIPSYIANKIVAADPEETLAHIEWANSDNALRPDRPLLWRIDDWRTSYTRHTRKKELAGHERLINVRASELRVKFVRQLMTATGSDETMCTQLAAVIIKSRNVAAAAIYRTDITELLKADDELAAFKQQHNMK